MIPMTGQTINTTLLSQVGNGSFVQFEFELEDDQQTSDLLSLCIDEEESYFLIVHPATGKHICVPGGGRKKARRRQREYFDDASRHT